ncbi:PepSY domain-containing protein [Marinobacter sp.]|uniref:PepSY domain-containing protein n=1 Tax=Marinobacter sp. TaxID=50741 RepID=UPI00356AE235
MNPPNLRYALAGITLLLLSVALPLTADDDDHERARHALEAGEILSLGTIINQLERKQPGQILEVELERKDGRWVYEIKQLREGGKLVKIELDASNAEPLHTKEKKSKTH